MGTLKRLKDELEKDETTHKDVMDIIYRWIDEGYPGYPPPPTLVAFRDAYLAYRAACSEVGGDAAGPERSAYLAARRAWVDAGAPVGGEDG